MKAKMTCLATVVALLGGCAAESPLRIKSDPAIPAALALAQQAPKPMPAEQALAELRASVRSSQPFPSRPKIEERRFNVVVTALSPPTVYQIIGKEANLNVIVAADIKDPITISLKNVTAIEALESLRDAYGFEFEIGSGRMVISRPKILSKTFQMDYLIGTRAGKSEVKVSSGAMGDPNQNNNGVANNSNGSAYSGSGTSGNGNTGTARESQEGSKVTTTTQNDFWQTLSAVLKSIVSGKDGQDVIINPQSGLVYVRGYPAQLREVDRYLERTQAKVARQVVLEAKIIEVTLSSGSQGGINWSAFSGGNHRFSVGGNTSAISPQGVLLPGTSLSGAAGLLNAGGTLASAGALGVAFTGTNFAALMNFLQSQGEAQVLSAPRVATLNNQKAVLKVGTDEYFVTNVSSTATTNGTSTTNSPTINVQPFFSGIALDVTPQIDDQGYVILHVHPSVSDVAEKSKVINLGSLGTYTLPLASSNVNESDTIVRLLDGDIVAIGGLMSSALRKDGQKVPLAGDVPIAGELFRQHNDSYTKTELVILIKTTVINKPTDWVGANPTPMGGAQ